MKPDLDAADLRLLSVLQSDSSLTINEIGQRIHLSLNACWRRIKRLEQDGYISRRVAVLDADKMGLWLSAFVIIRLAERSMQDVAAAEAVLEAADVVTEIFQISGGSGYLMRVYAIDMVGFETFLRHLSENLTFSSVETHFIIRTIRDTHLLPLSIVAQHS